MKLIVNVFFALGLTICAAAAAHADNPALMIIRFNQKNVAYQEKLSYAVSQAVKAKTAVTFDVVDVTPSNEVGRTHGQEVVDAISRNGIATTQVTLKTESGDVTSEEVRIFVR